MGEELVLGIDIGTASTKAVLCQIDGTIVRHAQRAHGLSFPNPGWVEQDADRVWWHDVRSLCAEIIPHSGTALRGVCVSGIGPALVPCDRTLRPLRPGILYGIDTRASREIEELEHRFGRDAILARAGSMLSSQAVGPKLLWLRRNEPEVWKRTAGWYMPHSYVVARLTGAYVLDHHSASQCDPLYDISASSWAADWSEHIVAGVPLPELVWPSDQVGTVSVQAANETGLPVGTPVVAGTIDAWAEGFGAGVRGPGDLMLMYGSTMFFIQVASTPVRTPELWLTQGIERGTQTVAAGMSTAGSLTTWLRELVGSPGWDDLVLEAMAAPAGSSGLLVLPYFAGERTPIYDPLARGVIAGLTLQHTRGELLRSIYEATAFGARQILGLLSASAGATTRAVAIGGGTRAMIWPQIVSDVTRVEQVIPTEPLGAAYGDALLAAIGVGLVEPSTDWARPASIISPSPETSELYSELFSLYDQLYRETCSVTHRLAEITLASSNGNDSRTTATPGRGTARPSS